MHNTSLPHQALHVQFNVFAASGFQYPPSCMHNYTFGESCSHVDSDLLACVVCYQAWSTVVGALVSFVGRRWVGYMHASLRGESHKLPEG